MGTTGGLQSCFDTLVFCAGSYRGAQTRARTISRQLVQKRSRKRTGRRTESTDKKKRKSSTGLDKVS